MPVLFNAVIIGAGGVCALSTALVTGFAINALEVRFLRRTSAASFWASAGQSAGESSRPNALDYKSVEIWLKTYQDEKLKGFGRFRASFIYAFPLRISDAIGERDDNSCPGKAQSRKILLKTLQKG